MAFAHLFCRVIAALQLLAWLQEYRERLEAAAAPPVNPPLSDAQAELIAAYAAQSLATWEECTINLHQVRPSPHMISL